MRYFLSLFIFLISFLAPVQAINFAIPTQVGSYSNPIEPIKPKAKAYKWGKKPIENKKQDAESNLLITAWILGIIFIAGLVVFSIGFLQSIVLLFWLGLGLEGFSLLGLITGFLISLGLKDLAGLLFFIVAIVFVPTALFLKGLLLLILGLIAASSSVWIIGLALLLVSIIFFIILVAITRSIFDKPLVRF